MDAGGNMKLHPCDKYQSFVARSIQLNHTYQSVISLNTQLQPVIGYGFNLASERNLLCFLNTIGFDTTREVYSGPALEVEFAYIDAIKKVLDSVRQSGIEIAQSNLDTIMLERFYNPVYKHVSSTNSKNHSNLNRRKVFAYHDEAEAILTLRLISNACEHMLDYWLLNGYEEMVVKNSGLFGHDKKERVALISMVARGAIYIRRDGERSLPALHQALKDNDRINAWYQIRYNSNCEPLTSESSTKCAYYESELFGLYDKDILQSKNFRETCKLIYQMYTENRDTIMDYEKQNAPLILQANIEFNLLGENRIKTIEQSFKMAYDSIRKTQNRMVNAGSKHNFYSQRVA